MTLKTRLDKLENHSTNQTILVLRLHDGTYQQGDKVISQAEFDALEAEPATLIIVIEERIVGPGELAF
jgi:hypothetical protein